ncbi:histone-like nucleoid-structuring protein Lsr2 [Schaalia hyovaginalis]|uniref:histone-like nucleoid-structuring protein Lsr2 n=1 Tax=Schaalia hyovaginalis TaxID=29316 RepID=UPI001F1CCD20|nr:Lsr2 family protein [Schaalia hyovaginalis]MCF2711045.1 Lsr2 family protein [Schaalia hyovaginalis]
MKKTQVVLVDDIDGGAADDTIVFAFKGVSYEIDLSEAHIEEMTADFAKWTQKARRVGGRQTCSRSAKPKADSRAALIREWAKAEGVAVNERGRISADVVAAYEAAKA